MIKLDVACGQSKKEGYTGIDIVEMPGVDIVHDLEKYPWPIDSDSVTDIWCCHYIEHVSDLFAFFNEIYRILTPGGKVEFKAPYWNSRRAWQDPTHKQAISETTFSYVSEGWRNANKLSHYPLHCNFDIEITFDLSPEWANRAREVQTFAIEHYANVVQNINATLTKR